MRFGIVGDIMLGDQPIRSGFGIYSKFRGQYSRAFENIRSYLKEFDFLIGNLEGVVVRQIESADPACSAQKIPASALVDLYDLGFRYISIANNHSMEYGPHAFAEMCTLLEKSGLKPFGFQSAPFLKITESIGLLAFSTIPASYNHRPEYFCVDHKSAQSIKGLVEATRDAKTQCQFLIVFPHWGYEFIPLPSEYQYRLAENLIEAGADLIAGTHPHIVQTICEIDHKPVVFSLGNFISDYWQERLLNSVLIDVTGHKKIEFTQLVMSKNFIINVSGEQLDYTKSHYFLPENAASNKILNSERWRVRREIIFFLFKHTCQVLKNHKLIFWMMSRFMFIVKNKSRLQQDPNHIYK